MKQKKAPPPMVPMTNRARHIYELIALVSPRDPSHTRLVANAIANILGYHVATSAHVAAENYITANFRP